MPYADPAKRAEAKRKSRSKRRSEMTDEERQRDRERVNAYYQANRQQILARQAANYRADPEPRRKYARDEAARLRQEMLDAYGRACTCCGETEEEFLTLEHVNGDGSVDRAAQGGRNQGVYRRLRREGWPKDGYTLLCWNCNCSRGRYGYCPHQRQVMEMIASA